MTLNQISNKNRKQVMLGLWIEHLSRNKCSRTFATRKYITNFVANLKYIVQLYRQVVFLKYFEYPSPHWHTPLPPNECYNKQI